MRTTKILLSMLALVTLAAMGCDNSTPPEQPGPSEPQECSDPDKAGCVIRSEKQRITSPDVPSEDQTSLVKGNSGFALDLYQQVRGKEGNLFYSPFSISMALAMTWAGAKNETETAMAGTLRFELPQAQLHPAFNWLDLELSSRGKGAKAADGKAFRLNVVNALWGQVGYNFEQPFLDTLGVNYGAGMRIVDFQGDAQGSADVINGWVNTETEGKIKELVPATAISGATVLILTNAIYFNAAWKEPFKESATQNGPFTKTDGSQVTVPMMSGFQEAPYAEGDDYQALVMPYDGDEMSMVLVLPKGDLEGFEASFDADKLSAIVGGATEHAVDVEMPKFKFDYELGLKKTLMEMGMKVAFTPGEADFAGINSKGKPFIEDVLHKAFIGVNEAGTEAAAATAVIVGDESAPEPAAISLDRPFLFFIRDNATGSLLFVGRVADPS